MYNCQLVHFAPIACHRAGKYVVCVGFSHKKMQILVRALIVDLASGWIKMVAHSRIYQFDEGNYVICGDFFHS